MGTNYFKTVKLKEIAVVERAKKNEIHPKGTIYIQVSACKREGKWEILEESGPLESKYAVVRWKIPVNPTYMYEILNGSVGRWKQKYVGTNINIQMETFAYYELQYHPDIKVQNKYAEVFKKVNCMEKLEKTYTENLKELKKYHLERMFPREKS